VNNETLSLEEQAVVADSVEVDESTALSTWISMVPSLSFDGTQATLDKIVGQQANAGQFFQPTGCLTIGRAANILTYTFNGCTGPWGLLKLSGSETATFSPGASSGSLVVALHSVNLTVNNIAVTHEATATIDVSGATKNIGWSGSYSGTTSKGHHVQHVANLTITATAACVTIDGKTSSTLDLRGLDRTFDHFQRCGPIGTCPSGAIVAVGTPSNDSVTLTFDGTPTVRATGKLGGKLDFKLPCVAPNPT